MTHEEPLTHDKLQSECFLWFWNTYPQYRMLLHANVNSHHRWRVHDQVRLKSIGVVKGVLDLEFYYANKLYVFDIKIGRDRLSAKQTEFVSAITTQGGSAYEIRTLEGFKTIIKSIL